MSWCGSPISSRCRRRVATISAVGFIVAVGVVDTADIASAANNPIVVNVTASPNPVSSGSELTYTAVIDNTGGASLKNVVLTDQINGLTGIDNTNNLVITSTAGTCTQSNNSGGKQVRCDIGGMNGFGTATVTIRGVVTAANGAVLHNTAIVTGTKSAQTFTSSSTVSVQVQSGGGGTPLADLSVSVTAPSQVYPPGSNYYATLTVNNTGAVKANDVRVVATIPADATFIQAEPTSLFTCTHNGVNPGGTLTCDGGAVNTGANATIRILLESSATSGTSHVVTASVDPLNTVPETDELNNTGQATTVTTTVLPTGTLVITKSDTPDPIVKFGVLTYTIDVTNTTGFRADYVSVVDGTTGLDASSITASASIIAGSTGTGPTCVVSAPTVTCETTRFQPNSTMRVTISGVVVLPAGSTVINTATVSGNVKNKGITNTATATTTVRPGIDLTVTQHRTSPTPLLPVRAADQFEYTITVGNSGLLTAANVEVYEVLPVGVHFDDFSSSALGTTCALPADVPPGVNPQVVDCTIPMVAGHNSTETITLKLIAPQAIGPISSTVVVDPANKIAENDDSNNTFLTTTDVATGIDLTVTKDDDLDPVARNGTLRYTIVVSNVGTQDTTGVLVRDELPAGTVYRASSGDHNFTCGLAGGYVECTGGVIDGTYSGDLVQAVDFATIIIDVFAPDVASQLIRNEVRVDPNGTIPEIIESNNIAEEYTQVTNGIAAGSYRELHISDITDNFDPVATSGTLTYLLTVDNTGAAAADNVVVQAQLPATSIFRFANDTVISTGSFTCVQAGGLVTCTGGTIAPSGSRQISIGVFAPPVPGQALLEAIIDPANAILESDEFNNQANETTQVVSDGDGGSGSFNELHFGDIVDNFDPVVPDGTLVYTVPVINDGSNEAFGVTFRATLPTGSRFRSANDTGGAADSFSCTHAGGVVTCTGANIPGGGGARAVEISVFAPSTPGLYRLDALVDPDNAIPEAHEGNNAAEEFTSVALGGGGGFINLKVAKTATPQVTPGGLITYTIDVSNDGTDDAFNVLVRDALPAGTTFVSAVPSAGSNFTCVQAGGVVDCSGGYVKGTNNGGGNRTITIKVNAPLADDLTITNQVFVDPFNAIAEASEVDNTASADTLVESEIDLTITAPSGSVSQGTDGIVTATVTNTGTQTAVGVVAVFNLPIGSIILDVDASAAPGWSCTTNENPVNQVTCTGNLAPGPAVTFSFNVYRTTGGSANTNAVVDPGNLIVEDDEGNNTAVGSI